MILHVIDNLYPESGGPPTVAIELVRQQAIMGKKVALLCTHAPRKPEQRALLAERWHGLDIEYIVLDDLTEGGVRGARAAMDRLQPEIVHIHCMWEALVRQMAAYAKKRGAPFVLSTHGMLHPYALAQKRFKKLAYLTIFPGIVRGAGELFALNREEALYITERFGRPASVLANGIAVDDYAKPECGLFRSRLPAIGQRPFVLFVGRLHPIKGIDKLMRSYAHARAKGLDLELVLVGPDDGERGSLEALARELGLADHIHFTGGLFGLEKRDAFAACSIFAHRPRFEGFGITVVEGLASGKPVVTTRECKLDGSAEAGALRMAEDSDALLEIAQSADNGRALGMRGQEWARANLGWEALVEQAGAAYGRVVAASSRSKQS
jgi:glycosyltransferase involved in cell wall biosynthesis